MDGEISKVSKELKTYRSHKKSRLGRETFHAFQGSHLKSYVKFPDQNRAVFKHLQPICPHTSIKFAFIASTAPGQDKGQCLITTEATKAHHKTKSNLYFIESGMIEFLQEIKRLRGSPVPPVIEAGFHHSL
ncbi:MAG TPA: hypothetical protein DEA55_11965 [Rhodospirillaceae bacterium]|nr:hypothetical protein [Rhodospirillaceae bacterium]